MRLSGLVLIERLLLVVVPSNQQIYQEVYISMCYCFTYVQYEYSSGHT